MYNDILVSGVELSTPVDPVVRSLSLLGAGAVPQRRKGERGNSENRLKHSYIDVRPNHPFSLAWLVADI
jgi:hypothetical protein